MTQGIKVMFLKKDVLNNLTKQEKILLKEKAFSFWLLHAQYRSELSFAEILSDFIFSLTNKRFYMQTTTANAVSQILIGE